MITGTGYIDEHYLAECGTDGLEATPGAMLLGADRYATLQQVKALIDYRHPVTGEPLMRLMRNSPEDEILLGPLLHCTQSVSYLQGRVDDRQLREAVKAAAWAVVLFLEDRIQLRRGAGGHIKEPCHLIGFLALHLVNRKGERCIHVHLTFLRCAVTRGDKPRTYSIDQPKNFWRLQKECQQIFQLALGKELEKRLNIRCDYRDGRCEVADVTREQARAVSSRRADMRKAIEEAKIEPLKDRYGEPLRGRDGELKYHPKVWAAAAKFTRARKQIVEASQKLRQWREEAKKERPFRPRPSDGLFQRLWNDNIAAPLRERVAAFLERAGVAMVVAAQRMKAPDPAAGTPRQSAVLAAPDAVGRPNKPEEARQPARPKKPEELTKHAPARKPEEAREPGPRAGGPEQQGPRAPARSPQQPAGKAGVTVEKPAGGQPSGQAPEAAGSSPRREPRGRAGEEPQRRRRKSAHRRFRPAPEAEREAYRWNKAANTVHVNDLAWFLHDASPRPRREAHRAAVASIRDVQHKSINDMLGHMEEAYRRARRPWLNIKGMEIILAPSIDPSPDQALALQALASKHRAKIVQHGEPWKWAGRKRHRNQSMSQEMS